jgi:DNA invertase Pin-like site-specific DNA recombinase
MQRALEMIAAGEADTLAAVKLDRLSRDLEDWILLLKRADREGWSLVALDLGMDTSTPIGRACAHIMGVFAQLVRELIAANTKEGLAVARKKGKRLGRPSRLPEEVRARILQEREAAAPTAPSRRCSTSRARPRARARPCGITAPSGPCSARSSATSRPEQRATQNSSLSRAFTRSSICSSSA